MASRGRKDVICTDTIDSLTLINQSLEWSAVYQRYVNLFMRENNSNKIWCSGLANVACVLEVFDFRENIYLCA